MRENVESSARRTGKTFAKLTSPPKFGEGPSMEFQHLSDEETDIKDHTIQNVCSTFGIDIYNLDNFHVNETIRSMWAVFCLRSRRCNIQRMDFLVGVELEDGPFVF